MNSSFEKESTNIQNAPEYPFKLNPMLKIYLNYNMSLEHFQSSNVKGGGGGVYKGNPGTTSQEAKSLEKRKKASELLYIKDVGNLNPPDCNFYFNPGQTMLKNLKFIEVNQSNCDYLKMSKDMTIQEKYIYRLSS